MGNIFENEFSVSYSVRYFSGIIKVGVFEVECDSIEIAKEQSFSIVLTKLKEDAEDGDVYTDNIEKVSVTVTEKK